MWQVCLNACFVLFCVCVCVCVCVWILLFWLKPFWLKAKVCGSRAPVRHPLVWAMTDAVALEALAEVARAAASMGATPSGVAEAVEAAVEALTAAARCGRRRCNLLV